MAILTIRPLEVSSSISGATDNKTNDGAIVLSVSGGTPPYYYKWSNGVTTKDNINLYQGTYSVTIKDSKSDFVLYKSYTVESQLTPTPTPSKTPKATPTPTPTNLPLGLCVSNDLTQYEFSLHKEKKNNNYKWVNTDNDLTLYYDPNFKRWDIEKWNNIQSGKIVKYTNSVIPIGDWKEIGTEKSINKWKVSNGSCGDLPIRLEVKTNNESCDGFNDGTAILSTFNGNPPYYYRIQGLSPYPDFTTGNTFTSIPPGSYIAEVSADTQTDTTTFNISEGINDIDHVLSLNSSITGDKFNKKSLSYGVTVKPSLSLNSNLTFKIKFTHTRKYRTNGKVKMYSENNFTLNDTKSNFGTLNFVTSAVTKNVCVGVNEYTEVYEQVREFTVSQGFYLKGSIIYSVDMRIDESIRCDCPMTSSYHITAQLIDVEFAIPQPCRTLKSNSNLSSRIDLRDCINK